MDHIETKILNSYTIQEAAQNMVFAARLTRLRWGVLYLFMAVNLLSWVDFFKRRKPQKAGLGWQPQQDSHRTK